MATTTGRGREGESCWETPNRGEFGKLSLLSENKKHSGKGVFCTCPCIFWRMRKVSYDKNKTCRVPNGLVWTGVGTDVLKSSYQTYNSPLPIKEHGRDEVKRTVKCSFVKSSFEPGPDLVLFIPGFRISHKKLLFPRCIQCHLVDMTLDAPKKNATFDGKFGTLN